MPVDLNDILRRAGGAITGWQTGGLGGAVGGAFGFPPGTFPPVYGPGTGIGAIPGMPTGGTAPVSPVRQAVEAALRAAGATYLGNGIWKQKSGTCVTLAANGAPQAVACPPGAFTDPGAPWGGGGGDFGGGGAGGDWNPPAPPTGGGTGSCGVGPFGSVSIVEKPTYVGVAQKRKGYVTVTLPYAVGGYSCGERVQMLRELAIKFGLYKPRRRPVLTYADMKCIRKAERVENKLKTLTTRHTDYRVVKKK